MKEAENIVAYFVGLAKGVVDDYTLITLALASALVGKISGVVQGLFFFFTGYYLLRLVANIADVIGFHARSTAQANMQVAAALAQFRAPHEAQSEAVVDGDILP